MKSSAKPEFPVLVLSTACIAGGILFTFSLILMFSLQQLPDSLKLFFQQNDYLLRTAFFLSQLGFMAGLTGLLYTNALGRKRMAYLLLLIPLLGQLCYGVSAWLSVKQVMTLLPVPLTQLGAILNALGMLGVGMVVLRVKMWQGWNRWVPLCVGLYPFLVMFPILIVVGRPPSIIIGIWGLIWALLGISLYSSAHKQIPVRV